MSTDTSEEIFAFITMFLSFLGDFFRQLLAAFLF